MWEVCYHSCQNGKEVGLESAWITRPAHIHRRNAAERAIRTFNAYFLAILAGVAADFPQYLWDLLLPQAELTLNLLRQANVNLKISAWEYFQGAVFQYDATPLGPLGCPVMIHKKTSTRHSWDFRRKDGWSVGVAHEHYRCNRFVAKDTKAEAISDTVEYCHQSITGPTVTPADWILHGIYTLTNALTDAPSAVHDAQLNAITVLRNAYQNWAGHSNPTP